MLIRRVILNFGFIAFFFSAVITASTTLYAQSAEEDDRATLRIEQVDELLFGSHTTDNVGGSITIDPKTGRRKTTSNATPLKNNDFQRAEYTITGEPGEFVRIVLPSSNLPMSSSRGDNTGSAIITQFTSYPEDVVQLDLNGSATLYVGGTLSITKGVSLIDYDVNFEVSVEYAH